MKKNKLTKFLGAVLLAVVLVETSVFSLDVSAGSRDIIVDDSSFADGLNSSYWNNAGQNIEVSQGKIVFTSKNTSDSRLIMQKVISMSKQHEELFQSEYTLTLKKIPEGKRFVLAFGLAGTGSVLGEAESVALSFENKRGSLCSGVYKYDADGKEVILADAKTIGASFGSSVTVKVSATTDMKLKVIVNDKTIFDDETSVDLTGRMGFLQNASCEVEISRVYLVSHRYDTPKNPNVTEDFEGETINVNAFDSFSVRKNEYFPYGLTIEEYNGENVLMFRNVKEGWFGTTYQYSNFECTFDVPYILKENIKRDDGTTLQPKSGGFIFTYGDSSDYYEGNGYSVSADGIMFRSNAVRNLTDASIQKKLSDLGLDDSTSNEGYSVKVRMVDTQLTLYMKALDADVWQEVFSYKVGNETPTGYIHIWAINPGNFAIDNFTMTNLDEGANTIEVEYKAAPLEGAEDWVYEPMDVVYLDNGVEDEPYVPAEKGNDFGWITWLVLAVVVVAIVVAVYIIHSKGQKIKKTEIPEKEAENSEV